MCYKSHLVVLVGGDGDELSLGENEGVLSSTPPQHISGFNYMDSGLVAVQRVKDDLKMWETNWFNVQLTNQCHKCCILYP